MSTIRQRRIQLLGYYADAGRNLRDVLQLLGIKWDAALKMCRQHNIQFPDHKRRRRNTDD